VVSKSTRQTDSGSLVKRVPLHQHPHLCESLHLFRVCIDDSVVRSIQLKRVK